MCVLMRVLQTRDGGSCQRSQATAWTWLRLAGGQPLLPSLRWWPATVAVRLCPARADTSAATRVPQPRPNIRRSSVRLDPQACTDSETGMQQPSSSSSARSAHPRIAGTRGRNQVTRGSTPTGTATTLRSAVTKPSPNPPPSRLPSPDVSARARSAPSRQVAGPGAGRLVRGSGEDHAEVPATDGGSGCSVKLALAGP